MEVKQINQLMLAMGKTGIKKLRLTKGDVTLELEREDQAPFKTFDAQMEGFDENPMRQEIETHRRTATVTESKKEILEEDKEDVFYITSPMVGTVYYTPSPNDPPFVKPGDRVDSNTVVCIVEAMKVMNEVKAGVTGIISEPLAESGHPVEFGTKLFRVTPV
jgi:acetyl-CoA carboxylase biotin carboxyl carrier protein